AAPGPCRALSESRQEQLGRVDGAAGHHGAPAGAASGAGPAELSRLPGQWQQEPVRALRAGDRAVQTSGATQGAAGTIGSARAWSTDSGQLKSACAQVLYAELSAEPRQVGLAGLDLGQQRGFQQAAYFLVEVVAELAQAHLALAALCFQALPLAGLRQAVAGVQQLGRAAEETAAGEDRLEG